MHPMLVVATKAARRAGRIITRAADDIDTVKVTRKQQNDFVTEVDRVSEQEIIDNLLSAYPDHAILAEESGITMGPRAGDRPADLSQAEHIWIIDPLDGTTNFIHGLPQYAISIALMERGVITQGLVYDPNRDELFTATKGRGAFLNDRRIRVSRRTRIDEALIGTGFPYRKLDQLDAYMAMMKVMIERTAGLRRPGAAALDLAYVAAGRYDGFFEMGLAPWDLAAGSLLVAEAGGMVADFDGEARYLASGDIVAATPKVFGMMLPLLANARQGVPGTR
ncbi:MAG: inositol monophosphatase family protein [Burkholderiaceae bacterium]